MLDKEAELRFLVLQQKDWSSLTTVPGVIYYLIDAAINNKRWKKLHNASDQPHDMKQLKSKKKQKETIIVGLAPWTLRKVELYYEIFRKKSNGMEKDTDCQVNSDTESFEQF